MQGDFPNFWMLRGSLCDRMAEMTCFLMLRFAFDIKGAPEFVDVNPSLGRQCPPPYSDNPWRTTIPCLTGSGRVVVRFFDIQLNAVLVRPLLGVETMAVIGWDYTFWRLQGASKYSDSLLLNLSGNAFSAFAVLPMAMTAFSGAGILAKAFADAVDEASGEEEEADGEGSDVASSSS